MPSEKEDTKNQVEEVIPNQKEDESPSAIKKNYIKPKLSVLNMMAIDGGVDSMSEANSGALIIS